MNRLILTAVVALVGCGANQASVSDSVPQPARLELVGLARTPLAPSEVTVALLDATNTPVARTTLGPAGDFRFRDLPSGDYRVQLTGTGLRSQDDCLGLRGSLPLYYDLSRTSELPTDWECREAACGAFHLLSALTSRRGEAVAARLLSGPLRTGQVTFPDGSTGYSLPGELRRLTPGSRDAVLRQRGPNRWEGEFGNHSLQFVLDPQTDGSVQATSTFRQEGSGTETRAVTRLLADGSVQATATNRMGTLEAHFGTPGPDGAVEARASWAETTATATFLADGSVRLFEYLDPTRRLEVTGSADAIGQLQLQVLAEPAGLARSSTAVPVDAAGSGNYAPSLVAHGQAVVPANPVPAVHSDLVTRRGGSIPAIVLYEDRLKEQSQEAEIHMVQNLLQPPSGNLPLPPLTFPVSQSAQSLSNQVAAQLQSVANSFQGSAKD